MGRTFIWSYLTSNFRARLFHTSYLHTIYIPLKLQVSDIDLLQCLYTQKKAT
ncbi:MAG: hypothetical protein HRU09_19380 [Oligoflexales bacterium]|nr:hypothetical protein [Oligoflexales bacterium]